MCISNSNEKACSTTQWGLNLIQVVFFLFFRTTNHCDQNRRVDERANISNHHWLRGFRSWLQAIKLSLAEHFLKLIKLADTLLPVIKSYKIFCENATSKYQIWSHCLELTAELLYRLVDFHVDCDPPKTWLSYNMAKPLFSQCYILHRLWLYKNKDSIS